MSLHKLIAVLGAYISPFLLPIPDDVHRLAVVALWFILLDTLSGVIAARIRGEIGSRSFRLGLRDKLSCYAVIIGVCYGIGVLTRTPLWLVASEYGVIAAENFSILENLRPILRKGGKSMRPMARVLDAAASCIDRLIGANDNEINAPDVKAVETIAPGGEGGKENS